MRDFRPKNSCRIGEASLNILRKLDMYTVSKGPSKIVAKTRRGISHSQNLDNFRDQLTKKSVDEDEGHITNVSKLVFHPVNGKKAHSAKVYHAHQEVISPQHAELIEFVQGSWDIICKEYEQEPPVCNKNLQPCVVYHNDGEPSSALKDFKAFDLESWWGRRLFNTITKSI